MVEMSMHIQIAEPSGFCFGVERALKMAHEALSQQNHHEHVYTLGDLIHNPQVVESLTHLGLKKVSTLDEVPEGTLIIRSHGVHKDILEKAQQKGLKILDATCPFVKKAQNLASYLAGEGYLVVVVGEKDHPEVKGILGHADQRAMVLSSPEEAQRIPKAEKVGVVSQTTQAKQTFVQVVSRILMEAKECRAFDTTCNATLLRQRSALTLARRVSLMLVVGGKMSANTRRLASLCKEVNPETYHIESPEDIRKEWLQDKKTVGLCGGASTPLEQVRAIYSYLESL